MKRNVIGMMIILALSKVMGLLRTMVISGTFGAGEVSDIYFASTMIPGIFLGIVLAGLNTCLVPVLSMAERAGEKEEFFNRFTSLMILVSGLVVFLIVGLSQPLAGLVTKFEGEKLASVAYYTKFTSIIAGLQILTYTFMGYLQQNNRFFVHAAVAIPMNLLIIVAILLFGDRGIASLVIITILGYGMQLLWVLFPFLRERYPFRFDIRLRDDYLSSFLVLIGPIMLTTSASQVNLMVDANLASSVSSGSLSLVNYAGLVYGVFTSVVVMSFSTVLFTQQSSLSSQQDYHGICKVTRDNLSSMLMLIIPLTFGILFLSREVMELLYLRGSITTEDVRIMGWLLFFYSFSLAGWSINEVLGKFLISIGESKKTILPSMVNIGANIVLNYTLIKIFGLYGLAMASSLASYLAVAVSIRRTKSYFVMEKVGMFSLSMIKYLIAGFTMLAVLYLGKAILPLENMPLVIYIFATAAVGIAIYFVVLLLLNTEELTQLKQRLFSKHSA